MVVAVGITAGAAQRALARDFDGKHRDVPGQDSAPGGEDAFQRFHFLTIAPLRSQASTIEQGSTAPRWETRTTFEPSASLVKPRAKSLLPESSVSKSRKSTPTARKLEFPNKIRLRRDGRVVDGGGLENH